MTTDGPYAEWVGRTRTVEDIVTPRLVAGFEATLAPHLAAMPEGEAPLGLHWCLAPEAAPASLLGMDGHANKGDFLPPVPLPRRMWAGGELEFLAPLRVGERVGRRSTVLDVSEQTGRSGALTFVTVLHEIENDAGPAIRENQTIVYREAAGLPAAVPASSEPGSVRFEREWRVPADPVLLFRYSALTFNGHRIHYDQPYAVETEGYSGLVVHGPLQATLLLNLAAETDGRPPRRFSFRGTSPATGRQTLRALASPMEGGVRRMRIDAEDGRITMAATAAW